MPRIYWDRAAGKSTEDVQRVTMDAVDLVNWQGLPTKSLPRSITCRRGRVLGSNQRYAHAEFGSGGNMTAAECRVAPRTGAWIEAGESEARS